MESFLRPFTKLVEYQHTTCTFHVAPEAGQARRTGPNEIFRRLCHFAATPRACIAMHLHSLCRIKFLGNYTVQFSWIIRLQFHSTFNTAVTFYESHACYYTVRMGKRKFWNFQLLNSIID